jgi:hypothetical protein
LGSALILGVALNHSLKTRWLNLPCLTNIANFLSWERDLNGIALNKNRKDPMLCGILISQV